MRLKQKWPQHSLYKIDINNKQVLNDRPTTINMMLIEYIQNRCMDDPVVKWMDGWMTGWIDRSVFRWNSGQIDGQTS